MCEIVTDIKNGKPAHANFLSYEIKFLRVTDITPRLDFCNIILNPIKGKISQVKRNNNFFLKHLPQQSIPIYSQHNQAQLRKYLLNCIMKSVQL